MKVCLEWLKEFVDIDISGEMIAEKLSVSGLEVEAISKTGIGSQNIVVGKIVNIEKQKDSDTLSILKIDIGNNKTVQVVTNLSNIILNSKLLVALEGATLTNGSVVKPSKVKNINSEGVLVRWEDLNFDYKGDIPILIPNSIECGTNYRELANFEDIVIELSVTPNRGDCLGILGIAREVSALINRPLKKIDKKYKTSNTNINDKVKVSVESKDCFRYSGAVVENIIIEPSPLQIQVRLVSSGVRPISNIVDLTNYVMLEMNQPFHAFSLDKIEDRELIIREAKENEKIVTLDNNERKLANYDILITDKNEPQCIGGIMGGANSEITQETKEIFLESAIFNPVNIRKTSRRLGLKSEASYRFERAIDRDGTIENLKRLLYLLSKFNIGEIAQGVIDVYHNKLKPLTIKVDYKWINNKLGTNISKDEMTSILKRLGFDVMGFDDNISITVPSYRNDISIKEDISEEIARIYGYNNITPTFYPSEITSASRTPIQKFVKELIELLYSLGLDEAFNMSFIGDALFDKMSLPDDHRFRKIVKMDIPYSDELTGTRNSLIPGMIRTIAHNVSKQNKHIALFEIGNVSIPSSDKLPIEERSFSIALAGIKEFKSYTTLNESKFDFYDIKGMADAIFEVLHIKPTFIESNEPFLHPHQQAKIVVNDSEIGLIGKLNPLVMENFSVDSDSFILEISITKLFENYKKVIKYREVPKYPSSIRDLAIIVDNSVKASSIIKCIEDCNINILRDIEIFDIYKGINIEPGKYSAAISMEFNKSDSTLTESEITAAFNSIYGRLQKDLGARMR